MLYLRLIGVLGFFTALMPFLGFPQSVRDIFYSIFGLLVLFFTYRLWVLSRAHSAPPEEQKSQSYVQNDMQ